ncbi:L-histidine N(alpha)-methyltransferase [Chamaesiphon minutus]|uniref:Putative methyltransferase n=1 Tax=Chamaesiphon minutus (strain ATCC 27169 / PCC 6605) TaxID=1173020 RepID=K9UCL1_CHAP6|nr:L-histidine N(alpha)-methyltransferase [Chamaesiphon minutus]AFY92181.1 putative methyltransferase [Chamaesiphon minutus PCC 6605]
MNVNRIGNESIFQGATIANEHPRFRWINFNTIAAAIDDGRDVIQGLSQNQKTLPCRYFYDDLGSELFEQITDLTEYYPTRTEQAILEKYASEIASLTGTCELVELGSGSSRKTHLLLEAYTQLDPQLHYYPIDVSAGILKSTALALLERYPNLKLCGLAGTYEQALAQLPPAELENRMVIFLGSTLGNLTDRERSSFLTQIQQALQPGEFFLLGVDLQKSIQTIEAAYNDDRGVTAEFNLNILSHLNHRFGGDFVLDSPGERLRQRFEHLAFYNREQHRIEMHLRSLVTQTITLARLNYRVTFEAGETSHTEISRKFDLPTLVNELSAHAFKPLQIWTDPQDWFGLLLCQRQCTVEECP